MDKGLNLAAQREVAFFTYDLFRKVTGLVNEK